MEREGSGILHVLSEEHTDLGEDLALTKVMKPMYISMACFGLVWKHHQSPGKFDLFSIHCLFTLLLVWSNAFHYFITYDATDKYGQVLFKKITYNIIAIQMACGISTFIYFTCKHIPAFLKQWENYKLSHGGLSLSDMTKHVRHRVVALNIVLFCVCCALKTFVFLSESKPHVEILIPIHRYVADPEPAWLKLVYIGINLYINMAWLQSIIFTACMCYLLNREFKQLSVQFSVAANVSYKDQHALDRLRKMRQNNAGGKGIASPPSPLFR